MGGAVGAAPTNSGLQGNNSAPQAGGGFFAAGPAQSAMPQSGGLPMASPIENAMSQFGGQQQNQQQIQQQQGFPTQQLGQLGTLTGDTGFSPASDQGMFAQGSFQQQPQQSAGLNTLTGLYSGSGDAGIDPRVQQAKQQDFGFGGAYGQQAQARQRGMFQQPQQYQQQSPFQQQPQFQGLQQLLSRMISNYQNRPQYGSQSPAAPMPAYSSPALSYKPDYMRAQEALNRTATTKAEAEAAAAAAAQAKLDAQNGITPDDDADFRAWQRRQYEASKYNYGG